MRKDITIAEIEEVVFEAKEYLRGSWCDAESAYHIKNLLKVIGVST